MNPARTQRLARLYERKLAAPGALQKSLLQQAFTGELCGTRHSQRPWVRTTWAKQPT